MAEANYFFYTSTAIALSIVGAYSSHINGISNEWNSIPLFLICIIFIIGAIVELKHSWIPQLDIMYEKYEKDIGPTGCTDANKKKDTVTEGS